MRPPLAVLALVLAADPALAAGSDATPPVVTLPEMVELAEARNTDMIVLRERVEQANAQLRQAWAAILPDGTVAGTYAYNSSDARLTVPVFDETGVPRGVRSVELQPTHQWSALAQIAAPLIVIPAWIGLASADDGVELARHTLAQGRADVLFSTAQAYYAAVTAERLVAAAERQLEAAAENERVAKLRVEVGETPKLALLRAGVERAAAEQDVIRAANAAASAKLALRTLAGLEGPFALAPPPEVAVPAAEADALVDAALRSRQDLAASRTAVRIAERAVAAAFWQFAPTVSASGQYRWSNAGGFAGEETTWLVSLTAAFTVFDGGGRLAAIASSRSREREAAASREGLRRRIVEEVGRALLDVESARANALKAEERARLARESAALASLQFEAGASTYLDVVDANSARFQAEVAAATEDFNVAVAALRLSRAIGALSPDLG